jgi:hypothetical protein
MAAHAPLPAAALVAPAPSDFPIADALAAVRQRVKAAGPPPPAPKPAGSAAGPDDDLNDDGGELMIWSVNLVYGELLAHSVVTLVGLALGAVQTARAAAADGGGACTFVDLGSGEGLPPCAAAAAYPHAWRALTGIELVPRLHRLALAHRAALLEDAAAAGRADVTAALDRVSFVCDDMLAPGITWPAEADVAFLNGTCYDIETLEALFKAIERLQPGAVVILTSHVLPPACGAHKLFELLHEATYDASWGAVTARIYRRKKLPRWLAGIKT